MKISAEPKEPISIPRPKKTSRSKPPTIPLFGLESIRNQQNSRLESWSCHIFQDKDSSMAILHQLLTMGALLPSTAVTIPHPNRVTHHQPNNTRESSSPAINDKMGTSELSAVTVLKVVIQDILRHLLNLPMATVSRQRHNMVDQAINRYATLEFARMVEKTKKVLPQTPPPAGYGFGPPANGGPAYGGRPG